MILQQSLILNFFREFYQQLLIQKAFALTGENPVADGTTPFSGDPLYQQIQNVLAQLLESQAQEAIKQGGDAFGAYYKEAQYLMTAYADEVFLTLEWSQQLMWENNLLESRIYGTHMAGQAVFANLDQYLARRGAINKDMGMLYLWVLGLGFEGGYRGEEDDDINHYKERLYRLITGKRLTTTQQVLFPEAYATTIVEQSFRQLPNPMLYNWVLAGTVGLFCLGSWFVWESQTSQLRGIISEILEIHSQLKEQ